MNLLANENFPLLSVRLIRNAGHDVASVIEDTPGAGDEEVLKGFRTASLNQVFWSSDLSAMSFFLALRHGRQNLC